MSRIVARDTAMRLVYEWIMGGEGSLDCIDETIETTRLDSEDYDFIKKTVQGTKDHVLEIDKQISALSNGWKLERISKVDLAILRVAVYEMLFSGDISQGIAINEAVELAKRYGAEKSPKFVNGVLGGISRSLASQEKEHDA